MSACVPFSTAFWIFKFSVVKRTIEHSKYHTQRESFTILGSQSFLMGKFPYLSSTESIIHYPFKHLFYERSSLLVYTNSAFFAHGSSSNQLIADRYASGSHTKFAFSSQSSLHILRSVIIFEFRLATEDHEKEFLIGIVGEARSVCTNLDKYSCIHHVDNRSQISCISGKSIRCPRQYGIVASFSQTIQKLHIDSSLP